MPPPAHVEGGKIYCIDTGGSEVTTVSSDTGNVTGPTWNPNGSQILYVTTGHAHESHDYAGARFRIVDLPGLEARSLELPPDILGARAPAWSPDGTRVAFVGRPVASPDKSHNDLYITTLSDGSTANLTNGAVPFIGMPSWSPEGDRVAFTSGYGDKWSLHVREVDGESATNTEIDMGDAFLLNLSWSPDGTRFAVQQMVEENFEICVLNADGSGLVNLSDHPLPRRRSGLVAGQRGDRLRFRPGRGPGDLSHGGRWFFGNPADGQPGQGRGTGVVVGRKDLLRIGSRCRAGSDGAVGKEGGRCI